jgi:hypothetical protein
MPSADATGSLPAAMSLLHISYVSRIGTDMHLAELMGEMERFRTRNLALGVTGCIAFEGHRVMQILEGPEAAVMALFDKIKADPRHADLEELEHKTVERMSFRYWGMVRRPLADVVFLTQLT